MWENSQEGKGVHSLVILRVEMADSGQFTCLAENVAGEARSTADLVVRSAGAEPGQYFHVTKVPFTFDFSSKSIVYHYGCCHERTSKMKEAGKLEAFMLLWLSRMLLTRWKQLMMNSIEKQFLSCLFLFLSGFFLFKIEVTAGFYGSSNWGNFEWKSQNLFGLNIWNWTESVKVTQEKQVKGERVGGKNESFTVEAPPIWELFS